MAVSLMCPSQTLIKQTSDMTDVTMKEKISEFGTEASIEKCFKEDVKISTYLKSNNEMADEKSPVVWRGKNLVATRRLEMGEVILMEKAVIELSSDMASSEKEVDSRVELLAKEDQDRIVLLQQRCLRVSLSSSLQGCPQACNVGEEWVCKHC